MSTKRKIGGGTNTLFQEKDSSGQILDTYFAAKNLLDIEYRMGKERKGMPVTDLHV